ncbi:MAG TPA: hypothetical protein VJ695_09875 [Nitrososphaera sp.]|nr:hypothetical protein [Nitrososphaera sp.]
MTPIASGGDGCRSGIIFLGVWSDHRRTKDNAIAYFTIFHLRYMYMQFGLQHPNYNFDYDGRNTSQIVDSLKTLATKAETLGFDSF